MEGDDGERLSAREIEILTLVEQGLTNAEIARRLFVAEQTVKFHLSRIFRKIGVKNRTAAAAWLRRQSPPSGVPLDEVV